MMACPVNSHKLPRTISRFFQCPERCHLAVCFTFSRDVAAYAQIHHMKDSLKFVLSKAPSYHLTKRFIHQCFRKPDDELSLKRFGPSLNNPFINLGSSEGFSCCSGPANRSGCKSSENHPAHAMCNEQCFIQPLPYPKPQTSLQHTRLHSFTYQLHPNLQPGSTLPLVHCHALCPGSANGSQRIDFDLLLTRQMSKGKP